MDSGSGKTIKFVAIAKVVTECFVFGTAGCA